MLGVLMMFIAYVYLPPMVSLTFLIIVWGVTIPFDFLRQKNPALNEWALHAFKRIMRKNEARSLAGTSYLLTGVLIIVLFFPRTVVTLTLLFLAFADPIASYFGILYGKDKIFGHKSIQGFMAAFFVCMALTLAYFSILDTLTDRAIVVSLLAGLVGAFSELIPIGKLDDNLTLPILSAAGLSILFYFFGIFAVVG